MNTQGQIMCSCFYCFCLCAQHCCSKVTRRHIKCALQHCEPWELFLIGVLAMRCLHTLSHVQLCALIESDVMRRSTLNFLRPSGKWTVSLRICSFTVVCICSCVLLLDVTSQCENVSFLFPPPCDLSLTTHGIAFCLHRANAATKDVGVSSVATVPHTAVLILNVYWSCHVGRITSLASFTFTVVD